MSINNRGIGEPLQTDELVGQNGYVDRLSSGVTAKDVLRLMFRRTRFMMVLMGGFLLLFSPMLFSGGIELFLFMLAVLVIIFGFVFGMVALIMLCTANSAAKMLMENNYILLLKDRLVIQNQSDLMTIVLRNEVPLSKIAGIEPVPVSYIRERMRKTGLMMRFLSGIYTPPVGGLYPLASKKENLLVLHLTKPHEIHCSGRSQNGMVSMGDKREYVKEIVVSVDRASHESFIRQAARRY
ncbi:MAG: hypothetical protein ACMUHU_03220 [Thermoplasmatota archaeon]